MPTIHDIDIVLYTLRRAGVAISTTSDELHNRPLWLYFRNNPDGSMRWCWPVGARRPDCLRFYHKGTRKARRMAGIIRLLFQSRLGGWFASGHMLFFVREEEGVEWLQEFALFTGTVGPNRKSLLWYRHEGKGVFLKTGEPGGMGWRAGREKEALENMGRTSFYVLRAPKLLSAGPGQLLLEDISPEKGQSKSGFSHIHDLALMELFIRTSQTAVIGSTNWWKRTVAILRQSGIGSDPRLPGGLIRKLELLMDHIDRGRFVPCCRSHGDFTPWNTVVSGCMLNAFDWELSLPDAPAGWDAFHFIVQSGILQDRQSPALILQSVKDLWQTELGRCLLRQKGFDRDLHWRLYLLTNLTYYLELYHRQPKWHAQVQWLLHSWNALMNEVLLEDGLLNARQLFILDLFDFLKDKPYTALKWTIDAPESLSPMSDIDLCIDRDILGELDVFVERHPLVGHRCRRRRSFMQEYRIHLRDGHWLSIDAIWQFKRKVCQMLDARQVLSNPRIDTYWVRRPSLTTDFDYTWLFYLLNGSEMPEKYQEEFLRLPEEEQRRLNEHTRTFWRLPVAHFTEALRYDRVLHAAVRRQLGSHPANRGLRGLHNRWSYALDTLRDQFRQKGLVITFSGVDGAGKSTVINLMRHRLEKQFRRRVVVLRHRPSLLPILSAWRYGREVAEQQAAAEPPRQGGNRNTLSSLVRFVYYFTDYWFGQFYIQLRYVWRGYIVLYDRYYFDFINDSRRSNIRLPAAFTAWFYRLLLKPRLNFFLYATPEDILERKQELDAPTIRRLTGKYLRLFTRLGRRYRRSDYIPIHNSRLEQTLETIVEHIKKTA